MTGEELDRRFLYHAPTDATRGLHEIIRGEMLSFAYSINALVKEDQSREMSLFFTALEEAGFWLHAHIARNL